MLEEKVWYYSHPKPLRKKRRKKNSGTKTLGKFTIEEVLARVGEGDVVFGDWVVNMNSARYHLFAKNTRCSECGRQATVFLLQKPKGQRTNPPNRAHFNLFEEHEGGGMVLFTKDHIIPKAKGGANKLFNLQTMCSPCNGKKKDKLTGPGPYHVHYKTEETEED